jgi:hypothetical protein
MRRYFFSPLTFLVVIMLALVFGSRAVFPQQSETVLVSRPGAATIEEVAQAIATVVAIDKTTRALTLKAENRTVEVIADDSIRNFDQIQLGDRVEVKYRRAVSLELKKASTSLNAGERAIVEHAAPGEKPRGALGREIRVLAEVTAVDPKRSTITLKGPQGNAVELAVANPEHFKVVKKGDKVQATYSEALAVAVTPAK